ncbi:hypothetical protein ACFE04_000547 [Oxalis oulophora]
MSEEHGYQRSGKKCREKFENLYKYYKKTKEGKAGRQDGKHYRFFRQLEALYGDQAGNSSTIPDTSYTINLGNNSLQFHNVSINQANHSQEGYNPLPQGYHKVCDSLSLSNSSDFDTSSSDGVMENNDSAERRRKRKGGRSWRVKIKEFIDAQMRKLIEKQETWLEKLTKTLEMKERERMIREEEWRTQESARIDREHKFWAKERAWIEARDAALMESLQNLSGRSQLKSASSPLEFMAGAENQNDNGSETRNNVVVNDSWTEIEITRLMELKNNMESRFQASSQDVLWDEIAAKMASFGFDKSPIHCKEKWDTISIYVSKNVENGNKKRKESNHNNHNSSSYNPNLYSLYNQRVYNGSNCEQGPEIVRLQVQANDGSSPSNSNIVNAAVNVNVNDSCFRFLMADGENLWENYGLKLAKENQ